MLENKVKEGLVKLTFDFVKGKVKVLSVDSSKWLSNNDIHSIKDINTSDLNLKLAEQKHLDTLLSKTNNLSTSIKIDEHYDILN